MNLASLAAAESRVDARKRKMVKKWQFAASVIGAIAVWAISMSALAVSLRANDTGVEALIRGVEHRYNQARTLSVDFTETYTIAGRSRRPESGNLVLRKPGRMRWTYSEPAGKLFVSDGRTVFLYTAADNRAERSTLKGSEDMRAPMAFLLGKLDLAKDFRNFETRREGTGTYLVADARSDRLPYNKIEMLIGQDYSIQQLTVEGRDGSVLGFAFRNETLNPTVAEGAFHFTIPPGAEVVDAVTATPGGN